jgi:lipoate-protein ligase A
LARDRSLLTSARSAGEWKSFHVDERPEGGRFLMARDAARLEELEANPSLGPSLFLYRWAEPTISLGYAQHEGRVLDAVAVAKARVPVVRRPTGGRAILHVDEWTFGVAAPLDHPVLGGGLSESLSALSTIIAQALAKVGVIVDPGAEGVGAPGGAAEACFDRAFGHELSVGGRKLAGAAQRRLSRSLLTQGTILAGPGQERLVDFLSGDPDAKRRGRESLLAGTVTVLEVSPRAGFQAFSEALRRTWQEGLDR